MLARLSFAGVLILLGVALLGHPGLLVHGRRVGPITDVARPGADGGLVVRGFGVLLVAIGVRVIVEPFVPL